jgi:formiminoglutamate deiminase
MHVKSDAHAGRTGADQQAWGAGVAVTKYFTDYAWLGGSQVADRVLLEVDGERISAVRAGVDRPADAVHLAGVTVPGMANAHCHAFHRALRGRTHRGGGTFWTWRQDMYGVAERLTPDSYYELARALYAEMALAGISCVGEFHYVHHGPGGLEYQDRNAMGEALLAAAQAAGIRITLLDACYLTGGVGAPLQGPQLRFGDGDADGWASRASELRPAAHARIGAAIHSVRAVPPAAIQVLADWSRERQAPLHFHLSEQRAENEACLAAYGRTPARLLAEQQVLGPRSSAVHATHLTGDDIAMLADSGTIICMTPTTERDLADGIGPARELASAGCALALGSDSNAIVDLLEEARAVELDERLRTERRGHWSASELLAAATADGHASLGWPEAGRLASGALADFATISLDSVRLSGAEPATMLEHLVFAASAADVRDLVIGGRRIVAERRHTLAGDVPAALDAAVKAVTL